MNLANNNRAETVLRGFREAVSMYGLPIRIRTDYGGRVLKSRIKWFITYVFD